MQIGVKVNNAVFEGLETADLHAKLFPILKVLERPCQAELGLDPPRLRSENHKALIWRRDTSVDLRVPARLHAALVP